MCSITKNNRRQCQACRFQKCLNSGMRTELIMSEEAVAVRRARIKRRQEHNDRRALEINNLTPQQELLTKCLVNAHQRCFISNYPNVAIRRDMKQTTETLFGLSSNSGLSSTSHVCITDKTWATDSRRHQSLSSFLMSQLVEISTSFTHEVINFAKEIPSFRSLPIEDQITLLKASSFEVCLIISVAKFNVHTCMWDHDNDHFGPKDIADAGFQQWFIEPVVTFNKNLRSLELHTTEYALMAALSIFSPDRPGLIQKDTVNSVQEDLAAILKTYMNQNRPIKESRVLFPKLLSFLTDLRTLSEIHSKQILLIQDEVWSPLLKEIFS
ncbi:nuclear receptor subfamily 1 group I member 2-like isoform X2 [Protopterus annectens]|nr:nuclear receptor subfamily 1 group I member 2-like isoform X2 [Protopterus annectens]